MPKSVIGHPPSAACFKGVMLCRNTIDVAAYGLQTAIVVMHLSRTGINSNELSIIMAIQVLLLWIKVQYYARYLSRNAPWLIHARHIAPSCVSCTHNPFENWPSAAKHAAGQIWPVGSSFCARRCA